MMWNWGPYEMMGGWGMSPFGMLFPILFFIVLVALVVWALRPMSRWGADGRWPSQASGLEALKERYARGQINREEFLQMKKDILE